MGPAGGIGRGTAGAAAFPPIRPPPKGRSRPLAGLTASGGYVITDRKRPMGESAGGRPNHRHGGGDVSIEAAIPERIDGRGGDRGGGLGGRVGAVPGDGAEPPAFRAV